MKTPDIYDTCAVYASGDIDRIYDIHSVYNIHGIEKIYKVVHRKTGKVMYVGRTHLTIDGRFYVHMYDGRNSNDEFLIGFRLVREGRDAFDIFIIEYCKSRPEAKDAETRWAFRLGSVYPNGCNRILHGVPFLEVTKKKMSAAQLGRKASAESRAKMSASQQGRTHTLETKAKIRAAHLGRKSSAETRAKLTGRKYTPASRAKMRASHLGKKHSAETRAKISAAHLGRKRSAETQQIL